MNSNGGNDIEQEIAAHRARREELESAGVPALERLVEIGRGSSGQCSRVRRFLLGLYNGPVWPLDLTDLRSLDRAIQADVLAVLAMDMHGPRREVHNWIPDEESIWLEFVEREGGWPEGK